MWTSTQTSTGVRAAVAAKLGLDLRVVDVITPDVGGGFGVKIIHPWPEELLVPMAARALGQPVKFVEDRREHFVSSAHERAQLHHVEVGFDDEGRLLGLGVRFWHDNGAYTPYGLIVPIITSTQLLGPYKPATTGRVFDSLYTNTVMVTPYRGAGRPQGVYVMERTMDAIAASLGLDRADVRAANFIQPDEFPYDHGLVFQDGRPLIYDSGDYPASLAKLKALVGWDEFEAFRAEMAAEGRTRRDRARLLRRGHRRRPLRGRPRPGRDVRQGEGRHRPDHQGQGHQTVFAQIVADELGVPFEDVEVVTGDTRRMRVRRRHVRVAGRRDERLRDPPGGPADPREGAPDRGRGARGRRRRPRDRRRRRVGPGRPRRGDQPGHGRRTLQPAALRLRRGVQGGHPVRRSATRASRRSPRASSRASRARTSTRPSARRSPAACTR